MFNKELSIVSDFGPHIISEVRLGEVVFIVCEGHGLEVQGHHCTRFNIAKLVAASGGVAVYVEELGYGSSTLWEVWVLEALIPLLIVVEDMIGLRSEEFIEFLVLKDRIQEPNLIDGGLRASVSDASESDHGEEAEVKLPNKCLIYHEERKTGVGYE